MTGGYKSQVGQQELATTGLTGGFTGGSPSGQRYNANTNLAVLKGMEERLREVQQDAINISLEGESPFMQKVYRVIDWCGFQQPQQRVQKKIDNLERTLAKHDLNIKNFEVKVSELMTEYCDLTRDVSGLGSRCLGYEKLVNKLTEEKAKLEQDLSKRCESLEAGSLNESEREQNYADLRALHEEVMNIEFDIDKAQEELRVANDEYENLEAQLVVEEERKIGMNTGLRNLRESRRDISHYTQLLKLYAEKSTCGSIIDILQLIQTGTEQADFAKKILGKYRGVQVEVSTVLSSMPKKQGREYRKNNEQVESLREMDKKARAEQMERIRGNLHGNILARYKKPSTGSPQNSDSSPVTIA